MLLKILRKSLGQLVITVDYLTRPKKIKRSEEEQNMIDVATKNMSLYQFKACPFCVRTRRTLHRLNLNIETRDAMNNPEHRETLLSQGGEIKVPCLRIDDDNETIWMYESVDIIAYLNQRFDNSTAENAA